MPVRTQRGGGTVGESIWCGLLGIHRLACLDGFGRLWGAGAVPGAWALARGWLGEGEGSWDFPGIGIRVGGHLGNSGGALLPARPRGRRPVGSSPGSAPCHSPRCRTSHRRPRTGAGSARSGAGRGRPRTGRRACRGGGVSAEAWLPALGNPPLQEGTPLLALPTPITESPCDPHCLSFPVSPLRLTWLTQGSGTSSPTPTLPSGNSK